MSENKSHNHNKENTTTPRAKGFVKYTRSKPIAFSLLASSSTDSSSGPSPLPFSAPIANEGGTSSFVMDVVNDETPPSSPTYSSPISMRNRGIFTPPPSSFSPSPSFSDSSSETATDGDLTPPTPKKRKKEETEEPPALAFSSSPLPPYSLAPSPKPKSPKGAYKTSELKEKRQSLPTLVKVFIDNAATEVPANALTLNKQDYITAQGPHTPEHATLFFTMCWERGVECFVTLIPYPVRKGNEHQGYRNHLDYKHVKPIDGFTISDVNTIKFNDYIDIITGTLNHNSNGEQRVMTQIRYRNWEDREPITHDMTTASIKFEQLAKAIEQYKGTGPIAVNCNGGVTRSVLAILAHAAYTSDTAVSFDTLKQTLETQAPYTPHTKAEAQVRTFIDQQNEKKTTTPWAGKMSQEQPSTSTSPSLGSSL